MIIAGTFLTIVQGMVDILSSLKSLSDPPELWERVGRLGFSLRRAGFSGVRIPDLVISVTAIHHDALLFTLDRHFVQVSEVSDLRILG